MVGKMKRKLIVVCGSVNKNEPYFEYWKEQLLYAGYDVIIPEDVPFYKEFANLGEDGLYHLKPYQKTANRLFYYKNIDKCYAILIVNDVDYIGVETSMEIGYAYARNKKIYVTNWDSNIDGIKSLLQEGKADIISNLILEYLKKREK